MTEEEKSECREVFERAYAEAVNMGYPDTPAQKEFFFKWFLMGSMTGMKLGIRYCRQELELRYRIRT